MAHDVFVSHSVKDKAIAEAVVARLEAESVRCWVAPRDVVPGADWGESIIDAIESSRIMVLIFSRNANGSSQIKREVERAVDKEIYTIPFRVDDIEPTRSLEYFISTSQWMDAFSPPLEKHLDKLAQTVKVILTRSSDVSAETTRPPEAIRRDETPKQARDPRPPSPAWLKPVAVLAVLLILGAAIWFPFNQKRTRLEEEKRSNLVASAETALSPPPRSPSMVDQARDAVDRPNILNQLSNEALSKGSPGMMNQLASPVETPYPIEPGTRTRAILDMADLGAVEQPSAVVQRYYDSINRRDLTQAYDCLSQGFKAKSPKEKFAQIFASTKSIQVRRLQETSRGDATSAVMISFVETDAENRKRQWERRVSLVKEGNAWRIDGTQSQ
jgi:hypothetical protein